jgi:hypothetical protein
MTSTEPGSWLAMRLSVAEPHSAPHAPRSVAVTTISASAHFGLIRHFPFCERILQAIMQLV